MIRGGQPYLYCTLFGDIYQFGIMLRSPRIANHFVATVNATQMECLQPCRYTRFTNIATLNIGRLLEMCNMCKYVWLDYPGYYVTKANEFITVEHIRGNNIRLGIVISSLSGRFPVRYGSYYSLQAFTFCSPSPRTFTAIVYKIRDIWRIRRASVVMHEMNVIDRKPPRMNVYKYKGKYEYISVVAQPNIDDQPTAITNYWLFYGIQCSKYDATLLTIHDYQELHFIVKSIIQPFLIERVYISNSHMYKVWLFAKKNSPLIIIVIKYIYVDLYWWVNLQ